MAEPEPAPLGMIVGLPTRDPFSGGPLVATRLENPATGTAFEGRFSLGWVGELTSEQLDFVGLLLARRNNLQKLAADLGIAYNTARGRHDEIARCLSGGADGDDDLTSATDERRRRVRGVLERLAAGELSPEDADSLLER